MTWQSSLRFSRRGYLTNVRVMFLCWPVCMCVRLCACVCGVVILYMSACLCLCARVGGCVYVCLWGGRCHACLLPILSDFPESSLVWEFIWLRIWKIISSPPYAGDIFSQCISEIQGENGWCGIQAFISKWMFGQQPSLLPKKDTSLQGKCDMILKMEAKSSFWMFLDVGNSAIWYLSSSCSYKNQTTRLINKKYIIRKWRIEYSDEDFREKCLRSFRFLYCLSMRQKVEMHCIIQILTGYIGIWNFGRR